MNGSAKYWYMIKPKILTHRTAARFFFRSELSNVHEGSLAGQTPLYRGSSYTASSLRELLNVFERYLTGKTASHTCRSCMDPRHCELLNVSASILTEQTACYRRYNEMVSHQNGLSFYVSANHLTRQMTFYTGGTCRL